MNMCLVISLLIIYITTSNFFWGDVFLQVILENNLNTDAMMIQMKSILQTFRNNSLAIGYDGRNCDLYGQENGPVYEWSLPGALMFSVTVITTIGQ